jgi:phenylacetic acid degradation operon negative regulatory protein
VIASTLLGARPPVLPVQVLVRSGQLFGLSEGTVRVALSRMVHKREIEQEDDGRYALTGHLLDRQAWQERGRRPRLRRWKGEWVTAVVVVAGRTHTQRSAVRGDMRRMRMGELREGVWMRPDNLTAPRITDAHVAACLWGTSRPEADPAALAASLWDLDAWSREAEVLRMDLADWRRWAATEGTAVVLAPGFVLSAAVLRHFNADPLLPSELLPPSWPGNGLRSEYEAFDIEFLGLWRSFMG